MVLRTHISDGTLTHRRSTLTTCPAGRPCPRPLSNTVTQLCHNTSVADPDWHDLGRWSRTRFAIFEISASGSSFLKYLDPACNFLGYNLIHILKSYIRIDILKEMVKIEILYFFYKYWVKMRETFWNMTEMNLHCMKSVGKVENLKKIPIDNNTYLRFRFRL